MSRVRPLAGWLRRWGPWAAIVIVVVGAGVFGGHRSHHPTLDQRTTSLAAQVRCPVCNGETVAESDTPPSVAIRSQIRDELAGGERPARILAGLTGVYGPGILEKPQARGVGLLVWVLPILGVAAAVVGLVVAFRRWRPTTGPGTQASVTDRRLVDKALGEDARDG